MIEKYGINQNQLTSKKHKTVGAVLNYIGQLLILITAVSEFVQISAFASFVGIHSGIASSALKSKICGMTAGIKNYKSIIKKN